MMKTKINKPSKQCVVIEKENEFHKGMISIRIIPLDFINKQYGNLKNFINEESNTVFEGDSYYVKRTNKYDESYLNI